MNLPFSTVFPEGKGKLAGKRTNFPEKIIRSLNLPEYKLMTQFDILNEVLEENEILPITEFQNLTPKPHTIRRDSKNLWKQGNKIHFWINYRTSNQFQFAPIVEVKSVQKVSMRYYYNENDTVFRLNIDDRNIGCVVWNKGYEDNPIITGNKMIDLSINDGFDNILDFLQWFNEDFDGKIIHWTDIKY